MSLINQFKEFLEDISIYNVYVEYDNTPLSSRGNGFITVGINSNECSSDVKNGSTDFVKNKVSFRVTLLFSKDVTSKFLEGYFDNNLLCNIMKSTDFNILSVQKDRPCYTKYFDMMQLTTNIVVEYTSKFN